MPKSNQVFPCLCFELGQTKVLREVLTSISAKKHPKDQSSCLNTFKKSQILLMVGGKKAKETYLRVVEGSHCRKMQLISSSLITNRKKRLYGYTFIAIKSIKEESSYLLDT